MGKSTHFSGQTLYCQVIMFNHPEKDWETLLSVDRKEDYQLSIF